VPGQTPIPLCCCRKSFHPGWAVVDEDRNGFLGWFIAGFWGNRQEPYFEGNPKAAVSGMAVQENNRIVSGQAVENGIGHEGDPSF
jgi:hypothetical protein